MRIAGEVDRPESEPVKDIPEAEKRRYFSHQPAWKRAAVTFAGVAVNFIIGCLLISFVLMAGTPSALVISGIQAGSPAQSAGLKEGDIIRNFSVAEDFISFVNQNKGQEITIPLKRDGKDLDLKVSPKTEDSGKAVIGVYLAEAGSKPMGFLSSLGNGFKETLSVAWLTLTGFWSLLQSIFIHGSLLPGIVGPVGIFSVAQQTGKIGLVYLVQLISLISINLAVINLVPFPALDGGRLFLILIEKIKGSPVPRKIEEWANGLGFIFLVLLMILITIRDVSHWF